MSVIPRLFLEQRTPGINGPITSISGHLRRSDMRDRQTATLRETTSTI